jgi:DNA polymerase-3 subunit epsilon
MINFHLDRPLVFIDLETTGIYPSTDRIIDITLLKIHPDGREESKTKLINPQVPIPEEATKVHGIIDDDVANEPAFRQIAKGFCEFLDGCDLCGFNIKGYDLPLLEAEFQRVEVEFSRSGRRIIDTMTIFHKFHRRNLEAAYRLYCGKELKNSHASDVDARASAEILASQLEIHGELPRDMEGLHQFCCDPQEANWVDPDGKFIYCAGEITFNFGKKYRGKPLKEVAKTDPGYLEWMRNADFSADVKGIVEYALSHK